jgi:hypothetical protein
VQASRPREPKNWVLRQSRSAPLHAGLPDRSMESSQIENIAVAILGGSHTLMWQPPPRTCQVRSCVAANPEPIERGGRFIQHLDLKGRRQAPRRGGPSRRQVVDCMRQVAVRRLSTVWFRLQRGGSFIATMVAMNERRTAHFVGLTLGAIFAFALILSAFASARSDAPLIDVRTPNRATSAPIIPH